MMRKQSKQQQNPSKALYRNRVATEESKVKTTIIVVPLDYLRLDS